MLEAIGLRAARLELTDGRMLEPAVDHSKDPRDAAATEDERHGQFHSLASQSLDPDIARQLESMIAILEGDPNAIALSRLMTPSLG
jgi:hypothetical protein